MPRRLLQLGALAALAALTATTRLMPCVIFNGSPSVPQGFYLRSDTGPELGAFVTVRAADVAPHYARLRGFDDANDRFIKRVAAGAGARVCATGDVVTLGAGERILRRAAHDNVGRPLPRWAQCRTLAPDEVFLLGDTSDSFDSRYWGPVHLRQIEGVWTPLRRRGKTLRQ